MKFSVYTLKEYLNNTHTHTYIFSFPSTAYLLTFDNPKKKKESTKNAVKPNKIYVYIFIIASQN